MDSQSRAGHLVVFAGQSNMLGHKTSVHGKKPRNKNILAWSDDGVTAAWRTAELGALPFNPDPNRPNNAALHFADALQKASGGTVYLIGRPVNGTPLLTWSTPNAANISRLLDEVAAGIDALRSETGRTNWVTDSFLWCQGESDDDEAWMVKEPKVATLSAYQREFGRMVDILRAQPWWSEQTTKFIAAELMDNGWLSARNDFYRDRSRWPEKLLMGTSSSTGLVDIGDNAHFDGPSLEEMGRRMFAVREKLAVSGVANSASAD